MGMERGKMKNDGSEVVEAFGEISPRQMPRYNVGYSKTWQRRGKSTMRTIWTIDYVDN